VAAGLGVALVGLPAQAVSPPYQDGRTDQVVFPDVTGMGSGANTPAPSASASSGLVSASSSVTESLPIGMMIGPFSMAGVNVPPIGIGAVQAFANARVAHSFLVGPGTYTVVMTFSGVTATAVASPSSSIVQASGSLARAGMQAGFECASGCPVLNILTQVTTAERRLACVPGAPQDQPCSLAASFTLTSAPITVAAGQAGRILVEGGVFTAAVVNGVGNASATASGTVSSITV
jgi:hypothetical protein